MTTTNAACEASITTPMSSRYLGQLCKHFQHKLPVTLDETHGRIEFPTGVCELDAEAESGALHLRLIGADRAALAMLEEVVTRHLLRFAFRETLELDWQPVN